MVIVYSKEQNMKWILVMYVFVMINNYSMYLLPVIVFVWFFSLYVVYLLVELYIQHH